jgi:hypothetical protein
MTYLVEDQGQLICLQGLYARNEARPCIQRDCLLWLAGLVVWLQVPVAQTSGPWAPFAFCMLSALPLVDCGQLLLFVLSGLLTQ